MLRSFIKPLSKPLAVDLSKSFIKHVHMGIWMKPSLSFVRQHGRLTYREIKGLESMHKKQQRV